jgi:small subunit ribosomal protein S13
MVSFINRFISEDVSIGSFLYSISGLGFYRINFVCSLFGVRFKSRISRCSLDKLQSIETFIFDNYLVDSDLKRDTNANLSTKIKSGSYAGTRLSQNLPSRGQRTKTNARTSKARKILII